MIVAEPKDFAKIKAMTKPYKKIAFVGCGTCVTVCLTGGEREVALMSTALRLARKVDGEDVEILERTIQRQCDWEFVDDLSELVDEVDAVLSFACGAGVQAMAERFPQVDVLPALDTKFVGVADAHGSWEERCALCGDCILAETGGICPIARCTKGILNGPCGGMDKGKCEVDPEKDCAWALIYERLKKKNRGDLLKKTAGPKDFRPATGPRSLSLRGGADEIQG